MPKPHLTFFVELESDALAALFQKPEVVDFLVRTGSAVSMGMLDLDRARAEVIRALEARGILVTAWLLLDPDVGYWLTADNAESAIARYREVRAWAERHDLRLNRIGLDIEAPKEHVDGLLENPLAGILERLRFRRTREAIAAAEALYAELVTEIHRDGRTVESYQFPFVLDERKAESSLIRRSLGLVNVRTDAEVLMLYHSYFGAARIRTYFPETTHIALGVTGGGVNADKPKIEPKLDFGMMEADLLSASRHTPMLYVFSLEGCVEKDMLPRLEAIDWSAPPKEPSEDKMREAQRIRRVIQWICANEALLDRVLPLAPEERPTLIARLWDYARRATAKRAGDEARP